LGVQDHKDARFFEADFSGAWFHGVKFSNVKISNAWLFNVDLSGLVSNLTVNGIDVTAFVEAELNARHPERLLLAPFDADGMRTAWKTIEDFSSATLHRARTLPTEKLNESVNEEWSYLETLRHLVFATDRWITGPVLGRATPFHPLGMPNPPHDDLPAGMFDVAARPTIDEVLPVRRERMNLVAELVATIDASELSRQVASPNGGRTTVMSCLHIVFRDEWWHNQYANRDLAILESN
jgi:hypothetical protein